MMQQQEWNVTTLGYNPRGAAQTLEAPMAGERVLLIDTRKTPWSQRPEWRQAALCKKYGKRYRWAGKYLGNANHANGGPIRVVDHVTGLRLRAGQCFLHRGDRRVRHPCGVQERCPVGPAARQSE